MSEIIWEDDIKDDVSENELKKQNDIRDTPVGDIDENINNAKTVENNDIIGTNVELNKAIEEELNKANVINQLTNDVYNNGLVSKETLYQLKELVPSVSIENMVENLTSTPSYINSDEVLGLLETVKNDTYKTVSNLIVDSVKDFELFVNKLSNYFKENLIQKSIFTESPIDETFASLCSDIKVFDTIIEKAEINKCSLNKLGALNVNKKQLSLLFTILDAQLPMLDIEYISNLAKSVDKNNIQTVASNVLDILSKNSTKDNSYVFENESVSCNDLEKAISLYIASSNYVVHDEDDLALDGSIEKLFNVHNSIKRTITITSAYVRQLDELRNILHNFIDTLNCVCNAHDEILNNTEKFSAYSETISSIVHYLNEYREAILVKTFAYNHLIGTVDDAKECFIGHLNDIKSIVNEENSTLPNNIKEVLNDYIKRITENLNKYYNFIYNKAPVELK